MTDSDLKPSTLRVFFVGAGLMLIWPATAALTQVGTLSEVIQYPVYLSGLIYTLFSEHLNAFSDWVEERVPDFWFQTIGITLVGLIALIWIALLFLPFIGNWRRRKVLLWSIQCIYAASQAIAGWFFVARNDW